MNKDLLKRITIFPVLLVVCFISIGCSNSEIANQGETSSKEETHITVTESLPIEEAPTEAFIEDTIQNNTHNIFTGIIGETEIQMRISREDNVLTAAYITRTDDENFFEGEMKSPTEFELKDQDGGYLNCTIQDSMGSVNGTGMISGENADISLRLSTFYPIGNDYDNYYSSMERMAYPSKAVEEFAQQIKDSINGKEEFLKLFKYPLVVRIEGDEFTVNNEAEMAEQYDILMSQADFREQIENMYTKYLFLTYDGACVENGIIWFVEDGNGDYKIWTINYRKLV